MSTRAQIGIYKSQDTPVKEFETLIYQHSDGYPEGVLPYLKPFLLSFNEDRGIGDTAYCTVRLAQYLTNQRDKEMRKFEKRRAVAKIDAIGLFTTGFGIDAQIHGDIEYFYHISPESIQVLKTGYSETPEDWDVVKTIPLTNAKKTVKTFAG